MHQNVVAIDGPSGSGKSTVAKLLAENLGLLYIDTGAMFRALAYEADQRNVSFDEGDELKEFLNTIDLQYGKGDVLISIDGKDLSKNIREHHVSKLASIISQRPSVRTFLLDFQRKLVESATCVMEGRDIGTVVFPNAFIKFFVTASLEIRAQRRLNQLRENGDNDVTLEQLIEDQRKRDESDMNREVAPLKQADDANLIDTSDHTLEEIVSMISSEVKTKASSIGLEIN